MIAELWHLIAASTFFYDPPIQPVRAVMQLTCICDGTDFTASR
jgi:hypothetical protein